MIKQLLIATTNKGKQAEISAILTNRGINLVTPQDIDLKLSVKETGKTYTENALLKAHAFCNASGLPSLADDTGLEVDALDGAPGLYSARFSPEPGATDADRRALLLQKLKHLPRPWTARFTCTMALVLSDGRIFTHSGICEGEIVPVEMGDFGFGYDRLFLCKGPGKTMAELNMDEKNHISHRAKAAAGLFEFIQTIR